MSEGKGAFYLSEANSYFRACFCEGVNEKDVLNIDVSSRCLSSLVRFFILRAHKYLP